MMMMMMMKHKANKRHKFVTRVGFMKDDDDVNDEDIRRVCHKCVTRIRIMQKCR